MTRVTLEFDGDTEKNEFEVARDGHKYRGVVLDLLKNTAGSGALVRKIRQASLRRNLPDIVSMADGIIIADMTVRKNE